jgi:hypothetical protein
MIIEPTVTLWAYTTLDVADHATNTASILELLPVVGPTERKDCQQSSIPCAHP